MKYRKLFLLAFSAILFQACKKETTQQPVETQSEYVKTITKDADTYRLTYDGDNKLTQSNYQVSSGDFSTVFKYDGNGRLSTIEKGYLGTKFYISYDQTGKVTSTELNSESGDVINNYTYTNGRVTTMDDILSVNNGAASTTTNFKYEYTTDGLIKTITQSVGASVTRTEVESYNDECYINSWPYEDDLLYVVQMTSPTINAQRRLPKVLKRYNSSNNLIAIDSCIIQVNSKQIQSIKAVNKSLNSGYENVQVLKFNY